MNLNNRLWRLEKRAALTPGLAGKCAECGQPMPPAPVEATTYRVEFTEQGEPTPDHCPGCGRQRVYRIEFDRMG